MLDYSLKELIAFIKENYVMMIRYAISGVSGIIANLVVFSLVVEVLHVWYMFAAIWGFAAAYVVTFLLHKFWTFRSTGAQRTFTQSVLYLFSAIAALAINTGLLYIQVEWFNFWPILAQASALFVSAGLSFVFTSQITFHQDDKRLDGFFTYFKKKFDKRMPVIFLLIVIGIFFMSVRLSFVPVSFSGETKDFVPTAQYIFNDGGVFLGHRYLKPLAPIGIGLIAKTFNTDYYFATLIEAQIGYFALILAVFWFGLEFFKSTKKAVLLSVLVMSTYPILRYGLEPLTESGIWAFYFGALAATLRWSSSLRTRWLWMASILLLGGILWKEYAALAGIIFGLVILTHQTLSIKGKIHAVLQGLFLTLLPWGIWQLHEYKVYGYTYLDWLAAGTNTVAYSSTYFPLAVIKSFFMLLTLAWIFVLTAWWKKKEITPAMWRFLLLMLIPSFGFLAWGYVSSRLFFSLVPLVALIAVIGLGIFKHYYMRLLVVVCIGLVNLGLVWVGYQPNVRTLINDTVYGKNYQFPGAQLEAEIQKRK